MTASKDTPALEPLLGYNADFIRLWTGGAVSGLGGAITGLAYPLLALSVTTSAGLAGLLGLVALSIGSLTRLPAGAIVDRVPLRRVLVGADLIRIASTAALTVSLVLGHLALWQLLAVAAVNAIAGAFSDVVHSVALRHVVTRAQLPQAFALTEGRGHAISLLGKPVGGLLYGAAQALPLIADLAFFAVSAVLSASIKQPMLPTTDVITHPRFRRDLFTGLRFLWNEPFLRATLLAASFYQFVFAGTIFALIAHLTATGVSAFSLGSMFAVAAVGGILGAIVAPTQDDGPDHGLDRRRGVHHPDSGPPSRHRRSTHRMHLLHLGTGQRRPTRRPDPAHPHAPPRASDRRCLPDLRSHRTPWHPQRRRPPRRHGTSNHVRCFRCRGCRHHHRRPSEQSNARQPGQ